MKDVSVFDAQTIVRVFERDKGRCAWCGRNWSELGHLRGQLGGWDAQHRWARSMGGSKKNADVGNIGSCVILCRGCHDDVERKRRVDAFAKGFAVSRNGYRKPSEVPIKHSVHGWCFLTAEGGVERCTEDGELLEQAKQAG